jgi:hypothetical protein
MQIIESEYKDYDKEFALSHYIKRLRAMYKYTLNKNTGYKILAAIDLLHIHGVSKNKFYPGVTDFQLVKFPEQRVFNN